MGAFWFPWSLPRVRSDRKFVHMRHEETCHWHRYCPSEWTGAMFAVCSVDSTENAPHACLNEACKSGKRRCIVRGKKKRRTSLGKFQLSKLQQLDEQFCIQISQDFQIIQICPLVAAISLTQQSLCGRCRPWNPGEGTRDNKEKKSFFHPSCLDILACFQGFRSHFVLLPLCYCLNIGSGELTAGSHEPITQQWRQRKKYLLNNVHFLCLLYFPWLQWELEDLQALQTWSWRVM